MSETPEWYVIARWKGQSTLGCWIMSGPHDYLPKALLALDEVPAREGVEYTVADIRFPALPSEREPGREEER